MGPTPNLGIKGGDWVFKFYPKTSQLQWLATEEVFGFLTSNLGALDLARYPQHFFYSGEDLTVGGGEAQKFQSSDVA